jgi:hypothetical protein
MNTELMNNNGGNGENFDLQGLMNVVGQNAMTVQNIGSQLGIVAKTVTNLSTDVNEIKSEISLLKLNEEVTTAQEETIIETAQKRICEILGNDLLERQKYFKIFAKRIYSDTRHNAGLGSKVSRTKKGDFQRVVDYMEAWIPNCGCAELRARADKNAEARKIARAEGYIK